MSGSNGLITKNSLFSLSNDKQTKEEIGNETLSKNGYGDMGIPLLTDTVDQNHISLSRSIQPKYKLLPLAIHSFSKVYSFGSIKFSKKSSQAIF